ncbi:ATP-binding protein [Streptomyces monticola]|uniref:ATP-binding protein n=1 Tax=Streptomyces monticola TaxID=2666263 RepID=A0ABW2JHD1_9ACTN
MWSPCRAGRHTMTTTPPCDRVVATYRWLSCDRAATGHARAVVRRSLLRLGCTEDTVDDAVLAVSELIANACEHAIGPYELRVRLASKEIICEVRDGDPCIPDIPAFPSTAPFSPAEEARGGGLEALCAVLTERGRGLHIVHELTRGAWGMERVRGGKSAWLALPLPLPLQMPGASAQG